MMSACICQWLGLSALSWGASDPGIILQTPLCASLARLYPFQFNFLHDLFPPWVKDCLRYRYSHQSEAVRFSHVIIKAEYGWVRYRFGSCCGLPHATRHSGYYLNFKTKSRLFFIYIYNFIGFWLGLFRYIISEINKHSSVLWLSNIIGKQNTYENYKYENHEYVHMNVRGWDAQVEILLFSKNTTIEVLNYRTCIINYIKTIGQWDEEDVEVAAVVWPAGQPFVYKLIRLGIEIIWWRPSICISWWHIPHSDEVYRSVALPSAPSTVYDVNM